MFSVGCMLAQLYLPGNAPLFTRRSLTQFRVLCRKRVYQKLEEATARQTRRAKAKGRASKDQFTSPRGAAALARELYDEHYGGRAAVGDGARKKAKKLRKRKKKRQARARAHEGSKTRAR